MIESLRGQKTIIAISHNVSTIDHCDQIFLMDKGILVDRGTYSELAANSVMFRKLAKIQGPN